MSTTAPQIPKTKRYTNLQDFQKSIASINTELDNIENTFNKFVTNLSNGTISFTYINLTGGAIFTAPDGKLFLGSVVYAADGVTPTFQLQQVTIP